MSSQGLEYYLLVLLRCINMKHSDNLIDRIRDVCKIIEHLEKVSRHIVVVKPRLYLLKAYLNAVRGRKSAERFYLRKARKLASAQGNKLIEAWSIQNERVISITPSQCINENFSSRSIVFQNKSNVSDQFVILQGE